MKPKKELKTVNINFVIEPTFNARLLDQAQREGRSLSNLIRYALEAYLVRAADPRIKSRKR